MFSMLCVQEHVYVNKIDITKTQNCFLVLLQVNHLITGYITWLYLYLLKKWASHFSFHTNPLLTL